MRLTDDKINHLSHMIVKDIKAQEGITFIKEDNDVRLLIKDGLIEGLQTIEKIEEKVRGTLHSYSRKIIEGSREWDLMFDKTFEEELQKSKPVKE